MRLQGKTAIVTGSGSGLGKAMIKRLAEEGAAVVVADTSEKAMNTVVSELTAAGHKAIGVQVDVTNRDQVRQLMATVATKLGRIDILVNNAGITRHRPFKTMNDEDWDLVLGVDLKGVFNCVQAVADTMIKQGYGKIVNISSNSGNGGSSKNGTMTPQGGGQTQTYQMWDNGGNFNRAADLDCTDDYVSIPDFSY